MAHGRGVRDEHGYLALVPLLKERELLCLALRVGEESGVWKRLLDALLLVLVYAGNQ